MPIIQRTGQFSFSSMAPNNFPATAATGNDSEYNQIKDELL